MTRRSGEVAGLKVRVSHEPTRFSKTHVAAAFERLVPVLERQTRQICPEDARHGIDATPQGAKPMRKR
jgi:hypothetical protein